MSDKSEIEAIRAVKRYKNTILMGENGPSDYLTEASNGDWVQATDYDALRASSVDWADYDALLAERDAARAELKEAVGLLHYHVGICRNCDGKGGWQSIDCEGGCLPAVTCPECGKARAFLDRVGKQP